MIRFIFVFAILLRLNAQTGWQSISSFGSNPGALNMYAYAPNALPSHAPLVVSMHGCTQNASQYAAQSGWNSMADRHQFYVVYPEQIAANNSNTCFNWFLAGDQSKNQGEALSIKQMVDYMVAHFSIDTTKIFVTGLSAGACMTNVMLACYPATFQKGAIMAGAPYKASTSALTASNALGGFVTQTPTQWGTLVKNENPNYTGPYPKVAIFHGNSDFVVNIANATEEVKQWTMVHGADQTADLTTASFEGNSNVTQKIYNDASNNAVVETYIMSNFGHAIALDTGSCFQQCGSTGTYAIDNNFNSTFWAAYFFGIVKFPSLITGNITVSASQTGVIYSLPNASGSSYIWTVPSGATIISGQGSNSITVNFGTQSGSVSVTETNVSGCKNGPIHLFVNVGTTGMVPTAMDNFTVFYEASNQQIQIKSKSNIDYRVSLYTLDGKQVISATKIYAISASTLAPGLYLIQLDWNGISTRKKVFIY